MTEAKLVEVPFGWCLDGHHCPGPDGPGCPGTVTGRFGNVSRCPCWCHTRDSVEHLLAG